VSAPPAGPATYSTLSGLHYLSDRHHVAERPANRPRDELS
jgi:hypothetical protein